MSRAAGKLAACKSIMSNIYQLRPNVKCLGYSLECGIMRD